MNVVVHGEESCITYKDMELLHFNCFSEQRAFLLLLLLFLLLLLLPLPLLLLLILFILIFRKNKYVFCFFIHCC